MQLGFHRDIRRTLKIPHCLNFKSKKLLVMIFGLLGVRHVWLRYKRED